jgi:hypothetical protein
VAEKLSSLSASIGKETSHGDGPLLLREICLEGLALLHDLLRLGFGRVSRFRQLLASLWLNSHGLSEPMNFHRMNTRHFGAIQD